MKPDLEARVSDDVERASDDDGPHVELAVSIHLRGVGLRVRDVPAHVAVRVGLGDYRADRPVAIEMDGYLLKVFVTRADEQPSRQRAPERGGRRGRGPVAAAGFAYEVSRYRRHAAELVVGRDRMNELVLTQSLFPFVPCLFQPLSSRTWAIDP
jgi:hypothetical protein